MDEPRLEMMPLIDVVFLLLTFFIFAIVLSTRFEVTDVRLPVVEAGGEPETARYVVLGLREDGSLVIDGEVAAWEAVVASLKEAMEGEPPARLLVAPDERAVNGDLFRLMDLLSEAQFRDLQFLRRPSDAGGGAGNPPAPGS